jgi:hypothetical protein
MRKRHEKDILAEAIAQLRKQGLSNPLPEAVTDETIRRIADCGLRIADPGTCRLPIQSPQSGIRSRIGLGLKLTAAAAVFILAGYVAGRLTAPDVDQLREALTPSVAASLEPVLRQKLGEEMKDHWQVAMAGMYVRLKEEVTQQYRDDLNRLAVQTLAASNATTNALLAELVQAIDTTQAQDLRRIALALSQIEAKRVQDRTQLAAGLLTLACRTEDEFSRTKKVLARFLIDESPQETELPQQPPKETLNERSKE